MQTIGEIKTAMDLEYGKSSARLTVDYVIDKVTDHLREVCSDFPFWFLRVEPGFSVPSLFPITTLPPFGMGTWLDNGWFMTAAGVDYYPLCFAGSGSPSNPNLWGAAEASRLNHIKVYSLCGAMQSDLKVVGSNLFWGSSDVGRNNGVPYQAHLQRGPDGNMYIRLHPTPCKAMLICLSYQLALPPWIGTGDARVNLMSTVYPRCLKALVGLVYSDFFHDAKAEAKYNKQLYGSTDYGNTSTMVPERGLIGKMKIDTEFREIQDADELGYYASLGEAYGRGGSPMPGPGAPFYYGDVPY